MIPHGKTIYSNKHIIHVKDDVLQVTPTLMMNN